VQQKLEAGAAPAQRCHLELPLVQRHACLERPRVGPAGLLPRTALRFMPWVLPQVYGP
jgi:hypothetical protein